MALLEVLGIFTWIIIGGLDGAQDLSALNRYGSSWWNKGKSWRNKWADPLIDGGKPWYYLWAYKPKYKEKFPYSSTFLVYLTDGWHLLKFVKIRLSILSVFLFSTDHSFMEIVYMFLAVTVCFMLGFSLVYEQVE
jgi:hypothetical protein